VLSAASESRWIGITVGVFVTELSFVSTDRSLTSRRPVPSKVSLTDGRCLLPVLSLIFLFSVINMVLSHWSDLNVTLTYLTC
jgi:hypothetical protein